MNHTHTRPFNGPLSGTTRVSRYQKGKTNLDFTEARDSEWQWHQLGHMQVCTSLQSDNHTSIPPLSFLQAGCPSCHPTNSVKSHHLWIKHTEFIQLVVQQVVVNPAKRHFSKPARLSSLHHSKVGDYVVSMIAWIFKTFRPAGCTTGRSVFTPWYLLGLTAAVPLMLFYPLQSQDYFSLFYQYTINITARMLKKTQ